MLAVRKSLHLHSPFLMSYFCRLPMRMCVVAPTREWLVYYWLPHHGQSSLLFLLSLKFLRACRPCRPRRPCACSARLVLLDKERPLGRRGRRARQTTSVSMLLLEMVIKPLMPMYPIIASGMGAEVLQLLRLARQDQPYPSHPTLSSSVPCYSVAH